MVIGTHALVQEDVAFRELGLAVIDEQHRFGVLQRATLRAKGLHPDVLVMTATPIPRTLALTTYGDLDVSVIREMPPGRKPIATTAQPGVAPRRNLRLRPRADRAGRQAYIIYPLVEESEKVDLKAATEMADHLAQDVFPEYRVALLHGRMKQDAKDRVMGAFVRGEFHILVSTTVVEVGVDVPNATVMVIEHAERFGLSQLHQLRGRVGRGAHKSYCILLYQSPLTDQGRERLKALTDTTDGFEIAERDLELRGPGDFFGTRQSGLPTLRVGDLLRDHRLMEEARREAVAALDDPAQASALAIAGQHVVGAAVWVGWDWVMRADERWQMMDACCHRHPIASCTVMRIIAGEFKGRRLKAPDLGGAAADVRSAARDAVQHPGAADATGARARRLCGNRRDRDRSAQPRRGARDLRRVGRRARRAHRRQPRAAAGSHRTAMLLSARTLRTRCARLDGARSTSSFSIRRTPTTAVDARRWTVAARSGRSRRRASSSSTRNGDAGARTSRGRLACAGGLWQATARLAFYGRGAMTMATWEPMNDEILAIYPGSFDPLTNGHVDIIQRGVAAVRSHRGGDPAERREVAALHGGRTRRDRARGVRADPQCRSGHLRRPARRVRSTQARRA